MGWTIKTMFKVCLLSTVVLSDGLQADDSNYVQDFRNENALNILGDFREFLSIPNTSAEGDQKQKNAEWIVDYIAERGFTSEIVRAGGAPYVLAERLQEGATTTVLFYAHFDGQPVTAENWASPPFKPTLRSGTVESGAPVVAWPQKVEDIDPNWRIFARSAGDDKAPIIGLMAALDAMKAAGVNPSINIKLILDGEEEIGSPTLSRILKANSKRLQSDLILFCDAPLHQSGRRQLVYGMRGSMTLEMETFGPARPLHSGHYGNWAPNPTETMMSALSSLKNADGSIAVEGYYDDVPAITPAERAAIDNIPNIDEQLKQELALASRERPEKRIEELVMEPAIVVKGFQAGGVGRNARNIIQPTAKASLNFRLVKNQTPKNVERKVEAHFKSLGYFIVNTEPSLDVRRRHEKVLKLDWRSGGYGAFKTALDGKESLKLVSILDGIDGSNTMQTPTLGGSLPIVLFEENLSAPIIVLPIANHDNNQHGRNENMRIKNLWDAIDIYAAVIEKYGG